MTTLEILKQARALIAKGWTQKAEARDADGLTCGYGWPLAESFCLYGAIMRVEPDASNRFRAAELLRHCLGDTTGMSDSLVVWNDAPKRTQQDVLALLDSAIEKAKEVNHDNG